MIVQTRRSILPLFLFFLVTHATRPSNMCRDVINTSDKNSDGILQPSEYVAFVALLSGGDLEKQNYNQLPFELRVNFITLRRDANCCEGDEGGISIEPSPNAMAESIDDYLRRVCVKTQGVIDSVKENADFGKRPAAEPTAGPNKSPTGPPSNKPTLPPTVSPIKWPTTSPSDDPSDSPTVPPSKSPSEPPQPSPMTLEHRLPPTPVPLTSAPVGSRMQRPETNSPTAAPTGSPTFRLVTEIPQMIIQVTASYSTPTTSTAPTTRAIMPSVVQMPIVPTTNTLIVPSGTTYPSYQTSPSNVNVIPHLPLTHTGGSSEFIPPPAPSSFGNVVDFEKGNRDDSRDRTTDPVFLAIGKVLSVALTVVFIGVSLGYVYINQRKQKRDDSSEMDEVQNKNLDNVEAGQALEVLGDVLFRNRNNGGVCGLGFLAPISEEQTDSENNSDCKCNTVCPEKSNEESDSCSAASESGWSSSTGLSSLNTASIDELDAEQRPGSFAYACNTLTSSTQEHADGLISREPPENYNWSVTNPPQRPPRPWNVAGIV